MAVETLTWLTVEIDREQDGRWIAEVPQLPGVITYGTTRAAAITAAQALAMTVLMDEILGKSLPGDGHWMLNVVHAYGCACQGDKPDLACVNLRNCLGSRSG